MSRKPETEEELLHRAVARLRAGILAIVFGLVSGTGLLLATLWLVVRGGHFVGLHLNLLSNYFPGYRVSWGGSIIGFFYAAALGAIVGWLIAWFYNAVVSLRAAGQRRQSLDS